MAMVSEEGLGIVDRFAVGFAKELEVRGSYPRSRKAGEKPVAEWTVVF